MFITKISKNRITAFILAFLMAVGFINIPVVQASGVSAGANHTAVILSDGTLWSWGLNTSGQLGTGDSSPVNEFIQESTNNTTWRSVSTGAIHTMAIRNNNTLWTWGTNTNGQLGVALNRFTPTQVPGTWRDVSAGTNHTVAIALDGTLWAWGSNSNGQIGINELPTAVASRQTPTQISIDPDWICVSAGTNYSMAIKTDGSLWGWGTNANGRLGNGLLTGNVLEPTLISTPGLTWSSVSAGDTHTLAIETSGALLAWGNNTNGRLGDGTLTQRTTPVQIGGSMNWVEVSAGTNHSVGRMLDGSIYAWGDNANGRLGNGTTAANTSNLPIRIGTDNNWDSVTAGGTHTVAVKDDGSIWAWGSNANGRLGDGTTETQRTSPTLIYIRSVAIHANNVATAHNSTRSMAIGDTVTLTAVGNGGYNALGGLLTWSVSDEDAVSFNETTGLLSVLNNSPGPVEVTASMLNGDVFATLNINIAPSIDGSLSALSSNRGTLTPVFNTLTHTYDLNIAYNISELTLSAKAHPLAASVVFTAPTLATGNVQPVLTGPVDWSADFISIPVGTTTVTITVTAQNTLPAYVQTYTVNIIRAAPTIELRRGNAVIAGNTVALGDNTLNIPINITGTAVGPFTFSVSPALPNPDPISGATINASITGNVLTITGTRPSAGHTSSHTITVTSTNPAESAATATLTLNANLSPPFTLTSNNVTINNGAPEATVTVGGTATGTINVTSSPALPPGITVSANSTTGVISIMGARPLEGNPDISGITYTLTVTRGGNSLPITLNATLTAYAPGTSPTFALTPATTNVTRLELNRDNAPNAFTQTLNVGGTAGGSISVSGSLPQNVDWSFAAGVITITTRQANTAQTPVNTQITFMRQGIPQTVYLTIDRSPPPPVPTFNVSPSSVTLTNTNLIQTVNFTGTATGTLTVTAPSLPSEVSYEIVGNSIVFTATRPNVGNPSVNVPAQPVTVTRNGITRTINVTTNLTALSEAANLTATPTNVTITDTALTATTTLSGTATGVITLNTSALPAGVTATVNQTTRVVTITGVRPNASAPSDIDGTYNLIATRQGVTVTIPVVVNLTRFPSLILPSSPVPIGDSFGINETTVAVPVSGAATGDITVTGLPSNIDYQVIGDTILLIGTRPTSIQPPALSGIIELTVTRQGATETFEINSNFTNLSTPTALMELDFSASTDDVTIDTPVTVDTTVTDTVTVELNTSSSTATGRIELSISSGSIPAEYTPAVDPATGNLTVSYNPPLFTVLVDQLTGEIEVINHPRTGNFSAINETFPITVTRQGASQTFNINVILDPTGNPIVLTPVPNSYEINSDNLTQTINVGGYAIGAISVTSVPALPDGVTAVPAGNTVVITGERPPNGEDPIVGDVVLTITRGTYTATADVTINLPPGDPTFTLTPSSINIADGALSRTVTAGGSAAGGITYAAATGDIPEWLDIELPPAGENTITITGEPPTNGDNVSNNSGVFEIIFTRGGIDASLTVTTDISPVDAIILSRTSVSITDTLLTQDVEVTGNATGAITLNTSALPNGVTAALDSATGTTIIVTGTRTAGGADIDGAYDVIVTRQGVSATLTVNVNLTSPPAFTPVTNITLSTTYGQTNTPFRFNDYVSLVPSRTGNATPTINDIVWEVVSTTPVGAGNITATINGSVLSVSGDGQGTVRVKATIAGGGTGGVDYTQEFTLTFSSMAVTASIEGLDGLYTGMNVSARAVFTLNGGVFEDEITASDFYVQGLPNGLVAGTPERINVTTVVIRITGAPTSAASSEWSLTVPQTIPARNMRNALLPAAVSPFRFTFGTITTSAGVSPGMITFDLNPLGTQHTDASVTLNDRDFRLRNIRYGHVNLVEDTDYRANLNNSFTILTSFLSRLPVGQWELTFVMSNGANPVVIMNIIDTARDVTPAPEIPLGPAPVPPMTPLQPDENFMYLSGGAAVNIGNLRWDLNRARITPQMQNGVGTVTIRTHVLDHMSWNVINADFEIITPMARIRIPSNILDTIYGGRYAIVEQELEYEQVDLRISVIDRSGDSTLNRMFDFIYPNGEILTPLVEIKMEFVDTATGEVFFTAHEFTAPISISFVVMNNAGHLRPAGVLFQRAWLEFVPYRTLSPNEITISTIFTGPVAVMNNRALFEDINLTHWGFVQSYTAAFSGLVVTDELSPNAAITRGEFAQLLSFALQLPRANANISGFTDVLPSSVYFDGVSRLTAAGLLGPYVPGTQFHPNAVITREEIAAIIGMALILGEPVREPQNRPLLSTFSDYYLFNVNHVPNIQETVNYGVMSGYPDGTFRPQEAATRVHALEAIMGLARALGVIDDIEF